MSRAGPLAEIYDGDRLVYESKSSNSTPKDLSSLIVSLREEQIKINDILTSLVESQDGPLDKNRLTSDSESDADDSEVNPKKCKLID